MKPNAQHCCPICNYSAFKTFTTTDKRPAYLCPHCLCISISPEYFPKPRKEVKRYDTHENSIEQKGYVRFLSKSITPIEDLLDKGRKCLDFGCGPTPVLSQILGRKGIDCSNYDPFYFPNKSTLVQETYDVVFATECLEHFHHPLESIGQMVSCLKPGGLLSVMTRFWTSAKRFNQWHYSNDETHVLFYHPRTMDYLAQKFNLSLLMQDDYERAIFVQNSPP